MQKFFKIGVSQKLPNRKTSVLESLFNKVAGLKLCNFMIKRLDQRCFPVNIHIEYFNIFENSFYYRTPPVAAFCQFDKVTVIGHPPTFSS